MKKQSKWIIGVVAVVVIVAAVTFSNTSLFKGSLAPASTYRNANIECYDGTRSLLGDASSCQLSAAWSSAAKTFCTNKCKGKKCGVNSFGVSNPCVLVPPPINPGTLSVQRDTVENIRPSQIVAGTTNVKFAAFRFSASNVSDVSIKKITLRNVGTNTDGIVSIGIYDGENLLGNIIKVSLGRDDGDAHSVTFDYTASPIILQKGTERVFVIKANTTYSATSGQTVKFQIDSIEFVDPTMITYGMGWDRTDSEKVLYPTKLNFAWVAPASQVLSVGNQVEVARFTMGADAANVNNSGAYVTVRRLLFNTFSNASLSNFILKDYTYNSNVATHANIPAFDSSVAGGALTPIMLGQGETRAFQILSDVRDNQNIYVRFMYTGTSTAWDVSNPPNPTVNNITWTVLPGDAMDIVSQSLSR